jgi:hypothetical protein
LEDRRSKIARLEGSFFEGLVLVPCTWLKFEQIDIMLGSVRAHVTFQTLNHLASYSIPEPAAFLSELTNNMLFYLQVAHTWMALISQANQTLGCPPILIGNLTLSLVFVTTQSRIITFANRLLIQKIVLEDNMACLF